MTLCGFSSTEWLDDRSLRSIHDSLGISAHTVPTTGRQLVAFKQAVECSPNLAINLLFVAIGHLEPYANDLRL